MNEFLNYLATVEFQAAYVVYEKNKRSMGLKHGDLIILELVSYYISKDRKESGKNVNVNFLIQEVGNWLKE